MVVHLHWDNLSGSSFSSVQQYHCFTANISGIQLLGLVLPLAQNEEIWQIYTSPRRAAVCYSPEILFSWMIEDDKRWRVQASDYYHYFFFFSLEAVFQRVSLDTYYNRDVCVIHIRRYLLFGPRGWSVLGYCVLNMCADPSRTEQTFNLLPKHVRNKT